MSDKECLAICQRRSTETYPAKLAQLVQELIKSLTDEDIPVKRPLANRLGRAQTRPAPSSGSKRHWGSFASGGGRVSWGRGIGLANPNPSNNSDAPAPRTPFCLRELTPFGYQGSFPPIPWPEYNFRTPAFHLGLSS